jgi:1,2-phenylacetyl-CoA epoxidase catalytic subunit
MSAPAAPAAKAASSSATRDLILVLADSKRLLGTRYAEWILGAPELETGIACASMSQDEWGHARLLYALLKEFGDDVDRLEHGREPHEYSSIEVLDAAPTSWPALVVLNALVDTALTAQLEALRESKHAPLRQRIGKLIDEEHFHAAHGFAWVRRLAQSDAGRSAFTDAARAALPVINRWFGQGEFAASRAAWADSVRALLEPFGLHEDLDAAPSFAGFNEATRRVSNQGPDAATIARVRGDKNRAFLMD